MRSTEDAAVLDALGGLEGDALTARMAELVQDRTQATQRGGGGKPSPFASLKTLRELGGDEDWLTADPPPVPMLFSRLVEGRKDSVGVIPQGQLMILAAEGGLGKTFVSLGACLAVATGKDWLGHFRVDAAGTAVGLFGETSERSLRHRIKAVAGAMGLNGRDLDAARDRFRPLPMSGQAGRLLDTTGSGATPNEKHSELLASLSKIDDLKLVVVDTLARFGAPDCETSQSIATDTLVALEAIANLPSSPVVIALHHTSQASREGQRPSTTGVRGVTALTDNARGVWLMTADQNEENHDFAWLKITKANDVETPPKPFKLARKKGGAWHAPSPEDERRYKAPVTKVKCPHCKKRLDGPTTTCPHCNKRLDGPSEGASQSSTDNGNTPDISMLKF